jgi:ABC-type sugar transport system permease subunit
MSKKKFRWPALALLTCVCVAMSAAPAHAAVTGNATPAGATPAASSEAGTSSLESAAAKAGSTGRAVAMSLIGLAFAVAATVLAFRRDFKEAVGVFAVG